MAQKTYTGTSLLDVAKAAVETFLKQRARDASARGDRYMLMTLEEFPDNVKAGWREGQAVFHEQLKRLRPFGLSAFGTAFDEALRFLNLNRMQSGIDNYGLGRYPFYIEPAVIVTITDGHALTSASNGVVKEVVHFNLKYHFVQIMFRKSPAIGNELTDEPFRWDQRIFSLVLRFPAHHQSTSMSTKLTTPLPSDVSAIDAMCTATGGRSYCVTSHKMLLFCIESIVQKLQQHGVMVRFENYGNIDPALNHQDGRTNGQLENGYTNKRIKDESKLPADNDDDGGWHSQLCMLYSRASRTYPGHWPMPEAFWPENVTTTLPPRRAHPMLHFRCESAEPLVCQEFPFDKYELEPCALTHFILDRKQANVCWQVFVTNSGRYDGLGYPFGYLKASTNLAAVNLFIMPYNYPVLLPLLEDAKQDMANKGRASVGWREKFDKYLKTVPFYYYQPLRKAMHRMSLGAAMTEPDPQYSYSVLSYLTKMKHNARDDYERACQAVTKAVVASTGAIAPDVVTLGTTRAGNGDNSDSSDAVRSADSNEYLGFKIFLSEAKNRPGPSIMFRNPFDIPRLQLLQQLRKMRTNLDQRLRDSKIPILEGGRPGTRLKLQHAEDLHNLPVSQMGNYQEYIKGLEASGKAPLREVEPQAIRQHAFGNPFKLDKKNMLVDEVGEGNILAVSSATKSKRPGMPDSTSSSQESSKSSKSSAPPRRKSGPLPATFRHEWRQRRRRRRLSSLASTSSMTDTDDDAMSTSDAESLMSDFDSPFSSTTTTNTDNRPSTSGIFEEESDEMTPIEYGHRSPEPIDLAATTSNNHIVQKENDDISSPPAKRRRIETKPTLTIDAMNKLKERIAGFVRRPGNAAPLTRSVMTLIIDLTIRDQSQCIKFGVAQALRFKRTTLVEQLEEQLAKLRPKR